MPTTRSLTAVLLMSAALISAQGCASKPPVVAQQFPERADLTVEAEPVMPADVADSDKAANDHEAAVLAWGKRGWLTVGRLCRWAADMGMEGLECPSPE